MTDEETAAFLNEVEKDLRYGFQMSDYAVTKQKVLEAICADLYG